MANVLLVDDSPEILEAMTYILHDLHGYEVRTARSGTGMMEELTNFEADVIVLDVLLSGENGKDICKKLKQNKATRDIPVILMSASQKLLVGFEECGASEVIAKPFHLSEMTNKIKSVLKLLPVFFLHYHELSHSFLHHL